MNPFSTISRLRISSKLLLFNLFTIAVISVVICTAFLAYRHVQSLLNNTVEQSLEQLNTSGRVSRGLSVVFADTNLLLATFFENQKSFDIKSSDLLLDIHNLQSITNDPKLKRALADLTSRLHRTFAQCTLVNSILHQRIDNENVIWQQLNTLDRNIADKLIDTVLLGEDPTILEQMATLLGGYRESMIAIGKTHAELWPEQYSDTSNIPTLPIITLIEKLIIRLHSMTAADLEISHMVQEIISSLTHYKFTLETLQKEMVSLKHQRSLFEKTKLQVLMLLEQIDITIVEITQAVRTDITEKLRLIGASGLLLGVLLLIFIGVVTSTFFQTILKRPMQKLHDGVKRFKSGDLNNKIELGRSDEWSTLETALNEMATDLSATHQALESKIHELEESIEAREQAEEAVRRSEANYRSIFENAVEGLYQISVDGKVLSANPAFARIFGYHCAENMIENVHDIQMQHYLYPPDREKLIQNLRKKGVVTDFETQFRRVDGEIIWGSINATLITGTEDGIPRIDGIFQDITDRKIAEGEKSALEDQLRQAQKMEAMGSLAGGIAHDFNNLLHAISGYLELLLLQKTPDDRDFKYITEIRKACARATEIAQRLLTFSRKVETRRVLVDMNENIKGTLQIIEATLPKMISIETRLDPDISKVSTDPTQMEQVLMNLAANARDAMPEGGKLVIETKPVTLNERFKSSHLEILPGNYTLLSVTDTGTGMDKQTLSHIFEPFYTTKQIGKGTGLGLSIVYGIVKSFNGHINCYSEIGIGTTFKIYLPATTEAEQGMERSKSAYDISHTRGDETVLVVDDEAMIRDIADEMLSTFGYHVIHAESGEEALTKFAQFQDDIDLIVLDLGMPGMGGEKCLAELLRRKPHQNIIVASGYAAHSIVKNPDKYGASKFISKPYQLEELLVNVRQILDAENVPQTSAKTQKR